MITYYQDKECVLIFGVFVDDILFLGTNEARMNEFYEKHLCSVFQMTLEKEPNTYLKFEIERDKEDVGVRLYSV